MNHRFCWNCYNFEDRRDVDRVVLCAKGHTPGTTCEDFVKSEEGLMEIKLNGQFCWNCCNFEDRRDVDETLLCAKGHYPEGNCDEFVDKNKKLETSPITTVAKTSTSYLFERRTRCMKSSRHQIYLNKFNGKFTQ